MNLSRYSLVFLCLFTACTSNEIGNSKDVNPQSIFINYSVFGEENDDSVTCLAQFRSAGENGTTLILDEPGHVQLDEENLALDSSDEMGAFYEKKFKTDSFAGPHSWKYVDGESNTYPAGFVFTPFSLKNQLPAYQSSTDSLLIELSGLQNGTVITTELSDTSSKTADILLKNKTVNGELVIPVSTWQNLSAGPVAIQVSNLVDTSLSINERPAEGGRLYINYSLKKFHIQLKNSSVALGKL